MKKQELEKLTKKEPKTSTLVEELQKEAQKIKPLTKWIRLLYRDCCGCGCNWEPFYREVPYDSNIKEGSQVTGDLSPTDQLEAPKGHSDYGK